MFICGMVSLKKSFLGLKIHRFVYQLFTLFTISVTGVLSGCNKQGIDYFGSAIIFGSLDTISTDILYPNPKKYQRYPLHPVIKEISGLSRSCVDSLFWGMEDSHELSGVYLISETGSVKSIVRFNQIKNRDFEDITSVYDSATAKTTIYVSDMGDNFRIRKNYYIHMFEDKAHWPEDTTINCMTYPVQFPDIKSKGHPNHFNCEAFAYNTTDSAFYLFTTGPGVSHIFTLLRTGLTTKGINTLIYLGTITIGKRYITAADFSSDGLELLLKDYTTIYRYQKAPHTTWAKTLQQKPDIMPYYVEPQGEAVVYKTGLKSYLTLTESNDSIPYIYLYEPE